MKYMLNKHTIHNTENNGLISIKNQNLIKILQFPSYTAMNEINQSISRDVQSVVNRSPSQNRI